MHDYDGDDLFSIFIPKGRPVLLKLGQVGRQGYARLQTEKLFEIFQGEDAAFVDSHTVQPLLNGHSRRNGLWPLKGVAV